MKETRLVTSFKMKNKTEVKLKGQGSSIQLKRQESSLLFRSVHPKASSKHESKLLIERL